MKACIWYISKYVSPPTNSGTGGRGYMIMREIAAMGYRCVIITSDSNQLTEVPKLNNQYEIVKNDGLIICWIRTFKYSVAKSIGRIYSWIDFEKKLFFFKKNNIPSPDVVIVSSLSLLTILNGFLIRKRYKCKLIFEIRDIWPLTITEEGGFKKTNPFVLFLAYIERLGYKYSDCVVGTMPNLKAHVVNVLGYNRKVDCVPMGLDSSSVNTLHEVPDEYIKKYIPEGKFIVAHAGTIGITNALDNYFKCAVSLSDNKNVHFMIIGDGDLKDKYIKEYEHLTNITFAPKVPKNMVQSVLSYCDLLYFSVHVSKVWEYGQSLNKVIDYMLSGKPVIASYTGYPSMINEAECGSFVPAGDINALKKEILRYNAMTAEEREVIGMRGRRWILKNRTYETLAKNYLALMFP